MRYQYDLYGWYAGPCNDNELRSTDIAPDNTSQTTTPGELRANWTGHEWVNLTYIQPQLPDNSELKVKLWEEIKQERDRRTQQGGYCVNGKWFHSDIFSRTQQMGLVMMGNNIPLGLQWKTMDGSFVNMTPELANSIFTAAVQSDTALFSHAEQLRIQMESGPENFSLSECSWPLLYGEQ